eukprot:146281_1
MNNRGFIMEVNKLQILLEYSACMKEMNKNEVLEFFQSLANELTTDELKSVIFCGLNKCKNQIDYDRFVAIKQNTNQMEQFESTNTSNELEDSQSENIIEIPTHTIWNLETASEDVLSLICLFIEQDDIISLKATSRSIALMVFSEMNKIPFNVMNATELIENNDFFCYSNIQNLLSEHSGLHQSFHIQRICYLYQNQYNIPSDHQLLAYLCKPNNSYYAKHTIKFIEDTSQSIGSIQTKKRNFVIFNSDNIGKINQTQSDIEETKILISKYNNQKSSKSKNIEENKLIILKYFDVEKQKIFIVDYIVLNQMVFLSQIDEYILNNLLKKYKHKSWVEDFEKYLKTTKFSATLPFKVYKECEIKDCEQSLDDNYAQLLTDDDRLCNVFKWPATNAFKMGRRMLATRARRRDAPAIGGVRTYSSWGGKCYENYYKRHRYKPLSLQVDVLIFQKHTEMINLLELERAKHDAHILGNKFYIDCNQYINDKYMNKRIEFKYNGDDNKYPKIKLIIPISCSFEIICYKLANQFDFSYDRNLKIYRVYRSRQYEMDLNVTVKEEYMIYAEQCLDDDDYEMFTNETCEYGCHSVDSVDSVDSDYESYDDMEHYGYRFKFEWQFDK